MLRFLLLIPAVATVSACVQNQPAQVLYPTTQCQTVQAPVYGVLDRPSSDGEVAAGAIIGGVIGNQVSNHDAGATLAGALIGGALVANSRQQEQVVVGYKDQVVCQETYVPRPVKQPTQQCSWQLYDPRITQWANEQLRKEYTPDQLIKMGFQNQWTCVENH